MTKKLMITTIDNPFNPFEQFDEWLVYDHIKGYYTNQRLASITTLSDQLSEQEIYDTIESSINELIKYGALDKNGNIVEYKKVFK